MHDKLAQLTSKLYDEGVEKGRKEAEEIIEHARREAQAIVKQAQHQAQTIMDKANADAQLAKRTGESDIVQAGKSAINVLKNKIESLLVDNVLSGSVGQAFMDTAFVQSVVMATIAQFNASGTGHQGLSVLLPVAMQADLEQRFATSAAQLLSQGVAVSFDPGLKAGFKIGPQAGSYYITFTEQDFNHLFQEYLRPKVRGLLFPQA